MTARDDTRADTRDTVGGRPRAYTVSNDGLDDFIAAPTVVVFRRWKYVHRDGSGIIALFPNSREHRPGMVMSYERIGQHGAADYQGIISRTRPATPAEYADLKAELERPPYRYVLDVRKRTPRRQTP